MQNSLDQKISSITSQSAKMTPKDFFLNLGSIVALYTVVVSLLKLLFSVINFAYPQINAGNYYVGSQSISWPVSVLIIFFPIFAYLSRVLEKGFVAEPEKKNIAIRKWLTYVTLFLTGLALAGDLVTILYYFIDGRELSTGFVLKVLSVFVVTFGVFYYYVSDLKGKLTPKTHKQWFAVSLLVIIASIAWGFSVLGSPRTQKLYKYDFAKISDLQNIDQQLISYWQMKEVLPTSLSELSTSGNYFISPVDQQSRKSYEYEKKSDTSYILCAEFNKASNDGNKIYLESSYPYWGGTWTHPAGRYCFDRSIDKSLYSGIKGDPSVPRR